MTLRQPTAGGVVRTALLGRLQASSSTAVVAVMAPPGYGKTTLLAQWAQRDERPVAWVSIEQRDNDPAILLTHVAAALDRIASLCAKALPRVLILDDVHLLQNWECLQAVAALADHLPEGSQLVVAGHGEPPRSLAGLRAEGRMTEIGADALAMDRREAGLLLRDAGMDLPHADVDDLVRRTEGWPVALYLAALSLKAGTARDGVTVAFAGDDRFLVDYLRTVLLSRLPPRLVSFLTRAAVLDEMSGPLCDAVLGTTGSASLLEALGRSKPLVIALDGRRRWYRHHRLFRELLRTELERREPDTVRELNLRAAAWCERNGRAEAAIDYALVAGDADRAARLLVKIALPLYHDGRVARVRRWLDWFDEHGLVGRHPAVAVVGAWVHALAGNPAAAERWADAAEHDAAAGPLPGGGSMEGWLALLRAALCRDGVERMRADAQVALAQIPASSRWHPAAHLLDGVAHLLTGEADLADRILARTAIAAEDAAPDSATVALAERSILAMQRGDWAQAQVLAERARTIARRASLQDFATSALLYAAAARVAIQRRDLPQAREDLARAERLRLRITYALPLYAVQTRLELARAHIALGDAAAARTMLREVDDLLRQRPDLGVLPGQAAELRALLEATRVQAIGSSSLTSAEVRLLRLLGSHHSFREIGGQLFVSPHTVKSHAMSIYRKFGVSSRGEAIERAHQLGLLAEQDSRPFILSG